MDAEAGSFDNLGTSLVQLPNRDQSIVTVLHVAGRVVLKGFPWKSAKTTAVDQVTTSASR